MEERESTLYKFRGNPKDDPFNRPRTDKEGNHIAFYWDDVTLREYKRQKNLTGSGLNAVIPPLSKSEEGGDPFVD